ncbi:unnamed protein product [Hermetia illucens]|uniref:EGF-like domain-containing protein n=1 Tax=Hermetia illucens TaxID=343691 RepID=A0A7R8YRZ7_HERIL|nr:neurogenic locus notch homolog protein 2-like [Hermetia illucens]CAD7083391.1 unnamed protein product [Hermetia illucens]
MVPLARPVILLLCLIVLVAVVRSCELDQTHNGCRIENRGCTCAFGCKSDYRYATRQECEDALMGTSDDICGRRPCLHGGSCIQISQKPGYKCRCEGTGFWGSRCQRQCPTSEDPLPAQLPYECIII